MRWIRGLTTCCLNIATAWWPHALGAQSAGSLDTTIRLHSRALGEERVVDIALPRRYGSGTERYPVIVVLDGEFEHEIASAAARFYASTSIMPPAIVVGVRNTQRLRDLTTTPAPGFTPPPEVAAANGGADRLLAFLGDELLPRIDSAYRTVPMRVLVGHSLGGLFALYTLTARPSLFTGYVVMEAAIWWNDEREWRQAHKTLGASDARRARVMLVNTPIMAVDTTRWGGDAPMVRELTVTGETHESMAATGMLQAFRTLFADFRPSDWKPGTRPVAMLERYDSLAARVGYDVPIPRSAYEKTIRMSIHARQFEDADRMLPRMEQAFGDAAGRELRELLAEERATPLPPSFIPLEIPAKRPTLAQAASFIGRWEKVGAGTRHEITVRPSGDTIIVHSRIQLPDGSWDEGDRYVIQVTPAGTLEWGLPWFRGIAALLVQKAALLGDGTMRVTREPRGWVPRGPGGEMHSTEAFRRVAP